MSQSTNARMDYLYYRHSSLGYSTTRIMLFSGVVRSLSSLLYFPIFSCLRLISAIYSQLVFTRTWRSDAHSFDIRTPIWNIPFAAFGSWFDRKPDTTTNSLLELAYSYVNILGKLRSSHVFCFVLFFKNDGEALRRHLNWVRKNLNNANPLLCIICLW